MMSFLLENKVSLFNAGELKQVVMDRFDQEADQSSNSCCVIDLGRIARSISGWKEMFPNVRILQRAGSIVNAVVFNFLARLGVQLTSVTGQEIEKLVDAGVDPKDIFYTGLCKINRHIKIASKLGVKSMTFSSLKELERLVSLHPDVELCYKMYATESLDSSTLQVEELLDEAKAVLVRVKEMGIKLHGVCCDFFPPGMQFEADFWFSLFSKLIKEVISADVGLCYVDLGSGEAVRRLTDSNFPDFTENVKSFISGYKNLSFYAEPNEYIVGSSALVCCAVTCVKSMNVDNTDFFYYLNDGVYGSFSKCAFSKFTSLPLFYKRQKADEISDKTTRSTFWGPTCDSMDKVCELEACPELTVGDIVVFDMMGCQSTAAATTFNGFPLPSFIHCFSMENIAFLDASSSANSAE